jgi:SAM-dependent methyltransferase
MAKQDEIEYLQKRGADGARIALDKPFCDATCSRYLTDLGAILGLLPEPPARLLDLGAGAGWTSAFFARRSYDVVSMDIAPDMTALAEQNKERYQVENLAFFTGDYEEMPFAEEFDCAVFYDALHHAVDERAALAAVYMALRPGGVLVTMEPGEGHSRQPASVKAMRLYGVNEKDMPPHHLLALGRSVGFRRGRVYVRPLSPELAFDTATQPLTPPPPTPPPAAPSRLRLVARHTRAALKFLLFGSSPVPPPPPTDWPPMHLRISNLVVLEK